MSEDCTCFRLVFPWSKYQRLRSTLEGLLSRHDGWCIVRLFSLADGWKHPVNHLNWILSFFSTLEIVFGGLKKSGASLYHFQFSYKRGQEVFCIVNELKSESLWPLSSSVGVILTFYYNCKVWPIKLLLCLFRRGDAQGDLIFVKL